METGISDTSYPGAKIWYRQYDILAWIMRLLASTDFALRVLMLLADEMPGSPVSVEQLAIRLGGLSRHHLHKIVQDLGALGVTRTVRGVAGGVLLAIPPEQVRLGDLVGRLECDQPIVECFRAEGCSCTLAAGCRLRGMLAEAKQKFYEHLDQHTLADCAAPSSGPAKDPRTNESGQARLVERTANQLPGSVEGRKGRLAPNRRGG